MFFNSKKNKCESCGSKVSKNKFNFCPYCGFNMEKESDAKNLGFLGKNDTVTKNPTNQFGLGNLGFTDKIIGSLVNNLMKTLDKQMKDLNKVDRTEIKNFPNGIKIRIGAPVIHQKKPTNINSSNKILTVEQIKKMSELPRAIAKSSVRRLSDKVVYELTTPGLESPQDVFVSKLEEGYEIKAIGNKKIYVNSIPVNLPMKGFSINENKLLVEFKTHEEF